MDDARAHYVAAMQLAQELGERRLECSAISPGHRGTVVGQTDEALYLAVVGGHTDGRCALRARARLAREIGRRRLHRATCSATSPICMVSGTWTEPSLPCRCPGDRAGLALAGSKATRCATSACAAFWRVVEDAAGSQRHSSWRANSATCGSSASCCATSASCSSAWSVRMKRQAVRGCGAHRAYAGRSALRRPVPGLSRAAARPSRPA